MKSRQQSFIVWLAIIGICVIGAVGISYFTFKSQERLVTHEKEIELTSIAKLKIDKISTWRQERLYDATQLFAGPLFAIQAKTILSGNGSPLIINRFKTFFSQQIDHGQYQDILLVKPDGKIILSASHRPEPLTDYCRSQIKASLASRQPLLSNLYQATADKIYLDLIVPVAAAGALVLHIDPHDFLYPLIQSWPDSSRSAETLLVYRDGDNVVFLNELRHKKGTALKLVIPITDRQLPAALAVLGHKGLVKGGDYRGVKVVAYLQQIPDSPWAMVAKVDAQEIYAAISWSVFIVTAVAIGLFLFFCLGLFYFFQRQIELSVYNEKERFQTTIQSIGDGLISTDLNSQITLLNHTAEQLTGWANTDAIGQQLSTVFNIFNEHSGQPMENPVTQALKTGQTTHFANHAVLIRKDGQKLIIADSAAPIHDSTGKLTGVVLIFRNVTEKAKMEAALKAKVKELENMQKALLNINEDLIQSQQLIKKEENNLAILNETIKELLSRQNLQEVYDIIQTGAVKLTNSDFGFLGIKTPENTLKVVSLSRPVLAECQMSHQEFIFKQLDNLFGQIILDGVAVLTNNSAENKSSKGQLPAGHPMIKAFLGVPICQESQTIGCICVANKAGGYAQPDQDVLETLAESISGALIRLKIEAALEQQNIKLEQLNKIKTEFTSNVSHELRTPLASIKEGIGIVLEGIAGNISDEQREFLEIAKRNVDRLHRLINDVLDFQKLESGRIKLNQQIGSLPEVVKEVVDSQQPVAHEKGLTIKLQIDKDLALIAFDRDRIIQVLNNYLSNAIKFSDRGEIMVSVLYDNINSGIKVGVADTGIGIAAEDLPKLFTQFQQLESAKGRKNGGTGLGLAISKQIIEQHHGHVWVESELGKGSQFWFTLPCLEPAICK